MKTYALAIALLALTGACSSSTSDRPTTHEERQAEIRAERQRAQAEDGEDFAQGDDAIDGDAIDGDDALDVDVPQRTSNAARGVADGDVDVGGNHDADEAAKHEPDNTGRNARDDEPVNLTALDQSNSRGDVDITQAIRKKVIADDALSFNAKNVKIITVGGKVTLKGPVASAQESSSIEKSARAVPGVVQVDNQIEVKR
jgi:hyperosmotically inducible protein